MKTAGTWSSSAWGKFESQALYAAAGKGVLLVATVAAMPDIMPIVGLLSLGEEIYRYTLLSTAKDSTLEDTDMETTQEMVIVGASVLSLFVMVDKMLMGGGDSEDDAEEAGEEAPADDYGEYYEEAVPEEPEEEEPEEEEPADDASADPYGGYY